MKGIGSPEKHTAHGELSWCAKIDASVAVWCSRCGVVAAWSDMEEASGVSARLVDIWRDAVKAAS